MKLYSRLPPRSTVMSQVPRESLTLPRSAGISWTTLAMRRAGIEALVRDALMAVRREAERHFRERLPALRCQLGCQRDGKVWAFDEVLFLGEEVVQNVRERRVGGAEAGGEEVLQGAGDLVGDDGGDHGAVAALAARCGEVMVE